MTPLSIPITNYDFYHVENKQKSLELINAALDADDLPSRAAHIVTFLQISSIAPFTLFYRLFNIGMSAINLIKDLFANNSQGERFVYHLARIFILDPMHFFVTLFTVIVHIFAAIIGMISPEISAKIWLHTTFIELKVANLFANCKQGLKIVDKTNEVFELDAHDAKSYLGYDRALKLSDAARDPAHINECTTKIINTFCDFLQLLANKYPAYLNKKLPQESMELVDPDWDSTMDINTFKDHLISPSSPIATFGLEFLEKIEKLFSQTKHTFIISYFTSGISFSDYNLMWVETSSLRQQLNELFYNSLHFGSVRTLSL